MTRRSARGEGGRPATSASAAREAAAAAAGAAASGRDVADRLHSAAIHLLRRLRKEDEASGLTAPRLSTLSVLVFGGPRTLGELAAAEQVKPPTMSRLVRGLERDGLVAREPDAEDGRVVWVRATPAGARVLEAARARRIASLTRLLEGLDPIEVERLGAAVAALERVLRGAG